MKHTAYLEISNDVLLEICRGLTTGMPRYFKVRDRSLPDDVEVVGAIPTDVSNQTITLAVRSEHFTEGERLPPPILETVYDA